MSDYDVIVAGGGVNGLVCATYLARGGHRVAVLERRAEVGGIAEVLHTAGRLQAGVIADLDLAAHGLDLHRPDVRMTALREDAPALTFWADPQRTAAGLAAISPADAEAYPGFDAHLRELAGFVAEVAASTPPRLDRAALGDAAAGLRLARAYRRLGPPRRPRAHARAADGGGRPRRRVVRRPTPCGRRWPSAGRSSRRWGRGRRAPRSSSSPTRPETTAAPPARRPSCAAGRRRSALALSRAARAAGAEVRTDAEVAQVLARDGRIEGISSQAASRSPPPRSPAPSTRRPCSPAGSTPSWPARGCAGGRATSARPGPPPGST